MANDFYQHSGWPGTRALNASASWRSEFGLIEGGFDKMPDVSTANLFAVTDGSALVGKTAAQAKVILALENVTNTADADKPISTLAQAALDLKADAATTTSALNLKAPLASPALTGTPTAPTPATTDISTRLATTAYVQNNLNLFAGSTAGYQKFPNGIVIQWGADTTHATAGTPKSTQFTLAFTSMLSLVATQFSNAAPSTNLFRAYNHQATGFQTVAGVSSLDFKYIAIGFITT